MLLCKSLLSLNVTLSITIGKLFLIQVRGTRPLVMEGKKKSDHAKENALKHRFSYSPSAF